MSFQVIFHDDVKKKIKEVPKHYQKTIVAKLSALSEFPQFLDIKKIKGQENTYRLRIGGYRAIFDVDFKNKIIYVTALNIRGRIKY
ncbi:MAG: type II toxin-antitoxin system RelE/ParE family toxin [Candidatus Aenigmarchaeota archaeon]|nr:type II toxin-antitoxin system RelE/ParE family toxin [Candidatus Aenigmarchaeota archaeon]